MGGGNKNVGFSYILSFRALNTNFMYMYGLTFRKILIFPRANSAFICSPAVVLKFSFYLLKLPRLDYMSHSYLF